MRKFLIGLMLLILTSGMVFTNLSTQKVAYADEGGENTVTLTKEDMNLLLPNSYEQYLSLDGVTGFCVKQGYVAIASENKIYVFNGEEYLVYEHTVAVVQLEFNEDLVLYLLDENGTLYTMDCTQSTLALTDGGLSCSAFTLADDTMYYAMSVTGKTNIYNKNNPTQSIETLSAAVTTVPSMTYQNNTLYYTDGQYLNAKTNEVKETYALTSDIYDIAVRGDTLYYTDKSNLYAYDLEDGVMKTVYESEQDSYTALALDESYLYVAAVVGAKTKICRFDTVKEVFTDYEISASSASANRLVSATQSIVSGDYLITADENRLSLYNYKEKSYASFHCAFTPEYLASDGKSIVIANTSTVYAYDYSGNPLTGAISDFNGNIMGVTCAQGDDYLLITRNVSCYRLDGETFEKSSAYTKDMNDAVRCISGDIYGNVYVEYANNAVYKYTQAQFLSTGGGELYYTFPTAVTNLAVDFDCNLYGLAGNTLYCSDGNKYAVNSTDCLFNASTDLVDFTFGFEHNTVYFLYEDYILATNEIDLPNLNSLNTSNSYQTIFGATQGAQDLVQMVSLREGAIFLQFSLENLKSDTAYFPYVSYARADANVKAVVLGETQINGLDYYMITVFNATTRQYTAGLVLKSYCTVMDESSYSSSPENFSGNAGYITNEVLLYKYPYLSEALNVATMPKNAIVNVIKELSLGDELVDYDYYYVSYTNANGTTLYGYVPKNFVRDFYGLTAEATPVYYTTLTPQNDITATAGNNSTLTLQAGKEYQIIVYVQDENEGDSLLISYEKAGVTYFATVNQEWLEENSSLSLKYFLVIVLIVLDVLIVVNYLVFRRKN